MNRGTLLAMGIILALVTGSAPAPARSETSVWTRETGAAEPPTGYAEFCRNYPGECVPQGSANSQTVTEASWRELVEINRLANLLVAPVTDVEQYRSEEVWAVPGLYGDCEDYALLKRKWLVERGWPTGSMLISVVFDELGDGHAVLVARTTQGDFVLDNKTDEIRLWSETPYRFVKRQSASDPQKWVRIGPPARQDVTTAAPSEIGIPAFRLLRGSFGLND